MKLVKLTKESSILKGDGLNHKVLHWLKKHESIRCKALNGRNVWLSKYYEIVQQRRDHRTVRKQKLVPAIELIRKAKSEDITAVKKVQNGTGYELKGITPSGEEIGVHIREEAVEGQGRMLFLISTF